MTTHKVTTTGIVCGAAAAFLVAVLVLGIPGLASWVFLIVGCVVFGGYLLSVASLPFRRRRRW